MSRLTFPLGVLLLATFPACVGHIDDATGNVDATSNVDVVMVNDTPQAMDTPSSHDAGSMDVRASTDVPPPPVDVPPPPVDVPMIVDTGGPMTCSMGPGLTDPIAGCMPTVAASTGDPHEDCVRRINQFRCECQHLPPLMRWTDGEACADMMAQYDAMHPGMPHAGFIAGICAGGYGENECPGWPSVPATVDGCLQQMWDEGPGPFYGPPEHGHYLNMSSTTFTMVACGFYSGSGGVYATQNFQ